jgi:integrase/recombinase XerD
MKLTYNIKALPRFDKIKADGQIPIYFSVRVGGTTDRLPTGRTITMQDWDKKNKCIKANTDMGQMLVTYLDAKMGAWRKYMLENLVMGKPITIIMAKAYFRENTTVTLFSFWQEQMTLWEESESKAHETIRSFKSTMNVLKQFSPKANFGDLNYTFIQKFDIYMSKVRGNGTGGKWGRHKDVKAIVNQAIMKGHMTLEQNPYRFFKIKASTATRNFLSIEEVRSLMQLEIPEKDIMLSKVRDLFLFSCFTGLRYSDVQNLRWENIKSEPSAIKLKMKKTSKALTIPLTANAKNIIHKYGKHTIKSPEATVLPQLSNQVINRNLKDLMVLMNINKQISYHCSRHTFASNHVEAKTNIIHLKDLLGHQKLNETQTYAKTLESDLYGSMEKLQDMYFHAV